MAQLRHGGCLCGQSRYQATGEPQFGVKCYCRDCQKVSGGGHVPQLAFPEEAFEFSGPVAFHGRQSDAGNDLQFAFCSQCGSPLFKYTSKLIDVVFVTAGSLDDPTIFTVRYKGFEDSRLPWDE